MSGDDGRIQWPSEDRKQMSCRSQLLLLWSIGLTLILIAGCATYYHKTIKFQESFIRGDFETANKILDENKKAAKSKDRLLYLLQKGVVLQMLGRYEDSNRLFEEAYLFTEDIQKNYALEALSLLSNPAIIPYRGEDFEVVQIHYYKALNYLYLNRYEEAQVECRRLNIKLNQLNDRYSQRKNRYRRDAFALNLMGIIFEASGDINNAFISYRNAYQAYKEDYEPYFNVRAPVQLKNDLLRSAYLNGFDEELAQYEKEFGINYQHQNTTGGELIFFVNNGLGPIKAEWSINFFIVKGKGGVVTFVNEEMGLSFPFPMERSDSAVNLSDLKFVRVAFPKYQERKPYFRNAELVVAGKRSPLEVSQDINEIAFKTLEDRMLRELATSLLRLAAKQAAEYAVSKKSEGLGVLLSGVNAITEKTDTRNWQTLPYSISYARIPLPEGTYDMELKSYSPHGTRTFSKKLQVSIRKGQTTFQHYHILDSIPLDL
jgi:hypothetical protein